MKRAEASAAGRVTPLLTRRSPRVAGRGCGARCGVRDPERCGPSRCCSLRGLGLGGGASLLGWERPAGQGGSEPAQSPPRPTAAGGGPASPGRFHLRAGPRPGAPAARKATGPRPGRSPQPVGGGGAARSGPKCEGGGAGWARDGRHARSPWPLAARRARTKPLCKLSPRSGGAQCPGFPKQLPALGDLARPVRTQPAPSSVPPPHGWLGRPERARGGKWQYPGRSARAPTHPAPWPCPELNAASAASRLQK